MNRLKAPQSPKIVLTIVLLGLFAMCLSSVSAFSNDTFTNNLKNETISFNGSAVRYISVPSGISAIVHGSFNLSYSNYSQSYFSGYWDMNNNTGSSLYDLSSGKYNLTITGSPTIQAGKILNALNFSQVGSGGTQRFRVAANYTGMTEFSWSIWIYSLDERGDTNRRILSDQVDRELQIQKPSGQVISFTIINNTGTSKELTTPAYIGQWMLITITAKVGGNVSLYINGTLKNTTQFYGNFRNGGTYFQGGSRYEEGNQAYSGLMDEISSWSRALTSSEVTSLWNSGSGIQYNNSAFPFLGTSSSANSSNLSLSIGNNYVTNIYANQNNSNLSTIIRLSGLEYYINNYLSSCTYQLGYCNVPFNFTTNNPITIGLSSLLFDNNGFIESNATYNSSVYETSNQTLSINITYDSSAYTFVSANLFYDGISYSCIKLGSGNNLVFYRLLDLPLVNSSMNKSFYWTISLTNSTGINLFNSSIYNQTVNQINLQICNSTYSVKSLNFTLNDELNNTLINGATNPTNFQATFHYWLGSGIIYKNYSFQNLSSSVNNYQFCIYPNTTVYVDMDSVYSATNFYENRYYLRGAQLTNTSSSILLYLLSTTSDATKFTQQVQQGVSFLANVLVQVNKQFVGLGQYKTTSVQVTDNNGQFPIYLDLDGSYIYNIIQNGVIIGTITKQSSCSAGPCSQLLKLSSTSGSAFDGYDSLYAGSVVSSISFDRTTKIVSYNFIDSTGLAKYVRLEVTGFNYQNNSAVLCNVFSYSASGTLTCDISNYTGNFNAQAFISRSPEKIDPSSVFSGFIDDNVIENIGIEGLFIVLGLIITLVFAAAVFSRGSPSTILFMFGIALFVLKIIHLLPFSWVTVAAVEVAIVYLAIKIKV